MNRSIGNHVSGMNHNDIAAISGPPSYASYGAGVVPMNGHYNAMGILTRLPCMSDDPITMTCHYIGNTGTLLAANNSSTIASVTGISLPSVKPLTVVTASNVHEPPSPLGSGITATVQLHDVSLPWPLPVISQANDAVPIGTILYCSLRSCDHYHSLSYAIYISVYLCVYVMLMC